MFSHRFLSGFQTRGSDTSLTLNTFPKDQLRRQYEYYLPVAVNSWDANSSQPNFDAWRTSVRTRARNGSPGNSYIKQVVMGDEDEDRSINLRVTFDVPGITEKHGSVEKKNEYKERI